MALKREEKTPLGQAIHDTGLSVRAVAQMCGLHYKTIEGFCKPPGRTGSRIPSPETLAHVCRVLKLDPTQFESGRAQNNTRYVATRDLLGLEDDRLTPC